MESESVCRCCGASGNFKDLYEPYSWIDQEEIYSNMITDCFSITLNNLDCKTGICELCISQLRSSLNFKKQIIKADSLLTRHLEKKKKSKKPPKMDWKPVGFDVDTKDEDMMSDSYNDYDIDEQDDTKLENPLFECIDPVIKIENVENEEQITKPKKETTKTKETKKIRLNEFKSKVTLKVKDEEEPSIRDGDGGGRKRKRKKKHVSATPERVEHRVNLTAILQHSNASPFRDKTVNGFSCLYCARYFPTIQELRTHTAQQTEKDKLNTMIDYKLSYNPIKVDITDLKCLICHAAISGLNELKDHLVAVHDKFIYKDIKDIILPFKLLDGNNFECVICTDNHISFKNLYHHMSSHYRNYCCDTCGVGYITMGALRKHVKVHENGDFRCEFCTKSYTSMRKKNNHVKGVHKGGWLRNKCPYCPQIFVSYYDRSEHLVKVHDQTPIVYPCNACNKIYKKKFELTRHIKHHHLQQQNYNCDICCAKYYSKRGLIDHMSRHGGSNQSFTCEFCGKAFFRQRSLRDHIKVQHKSDGNILECSVCKKKFLSKSSLKSHVRLHQDDLDIFKEFEDVKHLIDNRDLTLKQIADENKRKEAEEKSKILMQL